jgi:hypothetical protein
LRSGIRLALVLALGVASAAGAQGMGTNHLPWKPTARIVGTRWLDQVGPGAWITNTAYGYYLGRAYNGDQVAVIGPAADPLHLTVAVRPRRHSWHTFCGVVERAAVSRAAVTHAPNPCRATVGRIADRRRTVGREFNCPPHVCISGTFHTPPAANMWLCDGRFYANYVPRRSLYALSRGAGGFFDERGPIHGFLHYRFTTRDGRAAVVRDDLYGWGVVQRGCIVGHPLGGPLKPLVR